MDEDDTRERVFQVVAQNSQSNGDDIKASKKLEDLGIDNMDRVALALNLEEEFDITIDDDDVEVWEKVSDIVQSVIEQVDED